MFQFTDNRFTHMPFATVDAEGKSKEFCCIQNNGLWKLYHFTGQKWKRLKTHLPADATECSPCAEIIDGIWQISFIAGGYEKDRRFRLYRMYGLGGEVIPQTFADVGFIHKNQICYAGRRGPIVIEEPNRRITLDLHDVAYLYRVSFDPFQPNRLLISGEYTNGGIFSWTYKPGLKILKNVQADNVAAYKCAMFGQDCFYARRESGFEDRRILKAKTVEYTDLPAEVFITETDEFTSSINLEPEFV